MTAPRWLRRTLKISGAVVVIVVALELVLRLAAFAVQGKQSERKQTFLTGRPRVVALGDSNVFGLYVKPEQAWPAVLERTWNAKPERTPIEVLNLGYPGTNSSWLLHDFGRVLRVFHPQVVMLMVGNNDYWTVPAEPPQSAKGWERFESRLWNISRLYRFVYMIKRSITTPKLEVTSASSDGMQSGKIQARYGGQQIELGWQARKVNPPGVDYSVLLLQNLLAMAAEAKAAGVKLVLLTYGCERDFYGPASAQLRAAATQANLPLVDAAERFRPLCPEGKCDLLLPDCHPSAKGYELITQALIEKLIAVDAL